MTTIKINTKNIYCWFGDGPGKEKITIGSGEPGVHYTIIFKGNKHVVDLHKTIELPNGKKDYETILEMRFFTFLRFMSAFNKANIYLLHKFWFSKRINLGKLGHHKLVLFPLTTDDSKANLFIDNKRKKQIKLRKEFPVEPILEMFIYPDQIIQSKEKSFWVYSTKKGTAKRQGLIFKYDNDERQRSFYFVTDKQFKKYLRATQIAMFNILNQLEFTNKKSVIAHLRNQISIDRKKKLVV